MQSMLDAVASRLQLLPNEGYLNVGLDKPHTNESLSAQRSPDCTSSFFRPAQVSAASTIGSRQWSDKLIFCV